MPKCTLRHRRETIKSYQPLLFFANNNCHLKRISVRIVPMIATYANSIKSYHTMYITECFDALENTADFGKICFSKRTFAPYLHYKLKSRCKFVNQLGKPAY